MVVITDESTGVSQLLGVRARAGPLPKSAPVTFFFISCNLPD